MLLPTFQNNFQPSFSLEKFEEVNSPETMVMRCETSQRQVPDDADLYKLE
jgi:hypothetical protein